MENASDNPKLPAEFQSLFWDADPGSIDLRARANYVIERMLEYGTWEGIKFIRRFYGDEKLREYILSRGYKVLSRKTLNFWKLILHLEHEECLQPSSLKNSRPFWNY